MSKKTIRFSNVGASELPDNKPVVYRIKTAGGTTNYVGVAKRGRVRQRIREHVSAANIPGTSVQIEQKQSIKQAKKTEARIIARSRPKYNKQG